MSIIKELIVESYSPAMLIAPPIVSGIISGLFIKPVWLAIMVALSASIISYLIGFIVAVGMTPFLAIVVSPALIVHLPICVFVCALVGLIESRK
jgi:hypothetical protein